MNRLTACILIFLQGMLSPMLQAQDHSFMHLNKHYFITGEEVYFSFFPTSAEPQIKDEKSRDPGNNLLNGPVYVALLEIMENHQELKKIIKLRWDAGRVHGSLPLSQSLNSGHYLLGVFTYNGFQEKIPAARSILYIYNPEKEEATARDLKDNQNTRTSQTGNKPDAEILTNPEIQYEMISLGENSEKGIRFKGRVITDESPGPVSFLSVSVVDRRLYEDGRLYYFSPEDSLITISREGIPGQESSGDIREGSPDDNRNSRYIHGRLLMNGEPASIKKIYFYASKNGEIILDKYITSRNGEFWFLEAPFSGQYTIKLLTFPEKKVNYSYRLHNDAVSDSIFNLDPDEYPLSLEYIPEFHQQAMKKYLIDRSYLPSENKISEKDRDQVINIKAEPSHEIVLEDYIYFSTLPEIIREIVPQVNIKYKNGHYEMRIFDSRARNYCCEENPLIFVKNEPFMDIDPVMDINTEDIYSIEVIRPVEAIRAFGDIGVNGILKINLHPTVEEPLWPSDGKATFTIPGYQEESEFRVPDLPPDYPDFRSFLYWDGDLVTDDEGRFGFDFNLSRLGGDFLIVIMGVTSSGKRISKKIVFETENSNP